MVVDYLEEILRLAGPDLVDSARQETREAGSGRVEDWALAVGFSGTNLASVQTPAVVDSDRARRLDGILELRVDGILEAPRFRVSSHPAKAPVVPRSMPCRKRIPRPM